MGRQKGSYARWQCYSRWGKRFNGLAVYPSVYQNAAADSETEGVIPRVDLQSVDEAHENRRRRRGARRVLAHDWHFGHRGRFWKLRDAADLLLLPGGLCLKPFDLGLQLANFIPDVISLGWTDV
jgi:hypothetical protein